jgi:hypothetical protein
MKDIPSYKTLAEHRRVFDLIWSQMPALQNRTSSSWWFFILFPREEEEYGPRQLMFSIASRVGKRIRVNDVCLPGIDLNRPIENGVDRFHAISVGWYCDGRKVYEHIVKQPALATLSREGSIAAWADCEDGARYGGEINASANRPLGLAARFASDTSEARFEAWGEMDSLLTSPNETLNIDTVAGGVHFIAWRRMHFEGDFDLPGGRESLHGLCYFQRVCLNVPLFPWKWVWTFFPDGTVFSAYVPYIGLQLFRKGYRFFASNALERSTISVRPAGMWHWRRPSQLVRFDTAQVTPILDEGPHPNFAISARNRQGDFVNFTAVSYGHTRNYIDRPVLGGRVETHWSYNEYLFRMEDLHGSIGDRNISKETVGQGYGTLEYTWGLGL